jgi:hypothetical protein
MAVVFQTYSFADANLRVHVTSNPDEADIWVCQVNSKSQALRPYLWYFSQERNEAKTRIFLCSKPIANLCIFFVNNMSEAKVNRPSNLKGSSLG